MADLKIPPVAITDVKAISNTDKVTVTGDNKTTETKPPEVKTEPPATQNAKGTEDSKTVLDAQASSGKAQLALNNSASETPPVKTNSKAPVMSDSPAVKIADLRGPNGEINSKNVILNEAAKAGASPEQIATANTKLDANIEQMKINKPLLQANANRWSEINNDKDINIARNDTPEKTQSDRARSVAFLERPDAKNDKFWIDITNKELAAVDAREKGYNEYSSDAARVAAVAAKKAEVEAMSKQDQELTAPLRDNVQIVKDLGVDNVFVKLDKGPQPVDRIRSYSTPQSDNASLSNIAAQIGSRTGFIAPYLDPGRISGSSFDSAVRQFNTPGSQGIVPLLPRF
jgi:hypothetical protein